MFNPRKLILTICIPVTVMIVSPVQANAQPLHTIQNTSLPFAIRVAIRPYNNPRGPILWVQTVGFREYCDDVLPNEWMPSWNTQTLRAGAMAVKMFGWYHSLHPITIDGFTFDVDNTTNFQEYKYRSGTFRTDQAVRNTWHSVYVPPSGEIKALDYRAGVAHQVNWAFVKTNIMSQWGSQYWGTVARLDYPAILGMYYTGRQMRFI